MLTETYWFWNIRQAIVWNVKRDIVWKTSQELRMLSSVTLNLGSLSEGVCMFQNQKSDSVREWLTEWLCDKVTYWAVRLSSGQLKTNTYANANTNKNAKTNATTNAYTNTNTDKFCPSLFLARGRGPCMEVSSLDTKICLGSTCPKVLSWLDVSQSLLKKYFLSLLFKIQLECY